MTTYSLTITQHWAFKLEDIQGELVEEARKYLDGAGQATSDLDIVQFLVEELTPEELLDEDPDFCDIDVS